MTNIELYINGQLADIDSADKFSVYLKRQLINPAELTTKDAQKSYNITLPASQTNNRIFGHTNVEEVQGKFVKLYDARLLVGGVLILDGKFRISEITRDSYKGNLGVPAQKTTKEIFGEKKMGEIGEWKEEFKGLDAITKWNNTHDGKIFFPFVLYGLLPKKAINNKFSDKNVLDKTVEFKYSDFPPSIKCVEIIKHIFTQSGMSISGSAFEDERLNKLYVSYKNPADYEPPYSLGDIKVEGKWKSPGNSPKIIGDGINRVCNWDIFKDGKHTLEKITDGWSCVSKNNNTITINVPVSGLYKIDLVAHIKHEGENLFSEGNLFDSTIEIKLMRNLESDSMDTMFIDNIYCRNAINQGIQEYEAYYPLPGSTNFIDPKQNKHLLCGLSFGKFTNKSGFKESAYKNPLADDKNTSHLVNRIAIVGGRSWDMEDFSDFKGYAATKSDGYIYCKGNERVQSDKFKVNLDSGGEFMWILNVKGASANVNQVIWLEKDDKLTLAASCSTLRSFNYYYCPPADVQYSIILTPFRNDKDWLKIDDTGKSIEGTSMNWNDASSFPVNEIDLVKFLPQEMKVSEWMDNFCKTFNLQLTQTDPTHFDLNVKNIRSINNIAKIIDLDKKADIKKRSNQSLDLPSSYELGFTIDQSEQGYVESRKKNENGDPIAGSGYDGGGIYKTDSPTGNILSQKSNFSYNWFKTLYDDNRNEVSKFPVITDAEIWEKGTHDYDEMGKKTYFDKAQRFWYRKGMENIKLQLLADGGTKEIEAALVSNELDGINKQVLNYENIPDSIMNNYFLLLVNAANSYTTVECYLTPEEYADIANSYALLNGDLYYIAGVDGYDPMNKKQASLKLIRKIV